MCSDSIFSLLKKVTDNGLFIFVQNASFSFSTFFELVHPNLCNQIRCPQNWYTDLRLALDQPQIKMKWETIFIYFEKHSNIKIQKIENITLKLSWSIHPTICAEKSNLQRNIGKKCRSSHRITIVHHTLTDGDTILSHWNSLPSDTLTGGVNFRKDSLRVWDFFPFIYLKNFFVKCLALIKRQLFIQNWLPQTLKNLFVVTLLAL